MDGLVRRNRRRGSPLLREFLAEMMGTFILITFGVAGVAQVVLTGSKDFLAINFAWGLAVTFGVYWSAGISGGHINPSVTLAMVVAGRLPLKKLPVYWAAQSLGAFVASALVFGVYHDLLKDDRSIATAGIWSTYPRKGVSNPTVFGDQVVGTALLVGTIFALTDKRNSAPRGDLLPLLIGLLVLLIGATFGANVGYGINPARDLIPRIFTAIAGWKSEPFKVNSHFFWTPVVGQLVGGVVGAVLYIVTVEMHHEKDEQDGMMDDLHELKG